MAPAKPHSLPHLDPGEDSLADLAEDDPRDTVSFSDKEALILQLYHQIQEQKLEKALLEQGETKYPCSVGFIVISLHGSFWKANANNVC
jgi:hypothetical protein